MSEKLTLTMSQALVRYLAAQSTDYKGRQLPLFHGMFAIFGHGNVTGMGEALEDFRDRLPVFRAHNEQGMAHAAIAFAKASRRRRMMACTTSIGPGATNMVTAAALAHANRLPVLFLPGDVFANRLPDPVLQQIEHFGDPNITANDCFRPVSRYWDRITRPEQLLQSLPQALSVLTDPVDCGPVTLALPQDVQGQAWDYPASFFEPQVHHPCAAGADPRQLDAATQLIRQARRPLIIAGGGVHYSGATQALADFAVKHGIPVAETQAGKGALPWNHECNVGSIGVTGSSAANDLAERADLVMLIGTRLQDFTTGSGLILGRSDCPLLSINVARHDVVKRAATRVQADAGRTLKELEERLGDTRSSRDWQQSFAELRDAWNRVVNEVTSAQHAERLPSDAEVIGVTNRVFAEQATLVAAAGGLPGELHKLWRATDSDSYHVEYGYSCMGYEIAGGLGARMAAPDRDIVVMVGDGSYLMMNSEIATSVALGLGINIVVLNNRGFACINRLQTSLGGESYNNLWPSSYQDKDQAPAIDFAQHAAALGARAEQVDGLQALETALRSARESSATCVVVIDTDPVAATGQGGAWWDVPVAEVSDNKAVRKAAEAYRQKQKSR